MTAVTGRVGPGPAPADELVATGRLASVWRSDLGGRAVAVKRAHPTEVAAAALRREARVLGAVSHPAIVPVLAFEAGPPGPALVLAWADGGTCADAERLDIGATAAALAAGLDALHRAGALHLDVTPANVLRSSVGPWLCDPAPPAAGTPGYVDPAVLAGRPASPRSDVYGLAATIVTWLTGRVPGPDDPLDDLGAGGGAEADQRRAVLCAGLAAAPSRRPRTPGELVSPLVAPGPLPGRPGVARNPPRGGSTRPFPHLRERVSSNERSGDDIDSTHDTARVMAWRRTRRGG